MPFSSLTIATGVGTATTNIKVDEAPAASGIFAEATKIIDGTAGGTNGLVVNADGSINAVLVSIPYSVLLGGTLDGTTKYTPIAGRASSGAPTAVAAGQAVPPWFDVYGAQHVVAVTDQNSVAATPVISASAVYASGDVIGAAMTFTALGRGQNLGGVVRQAIITDRAKQTSASLELWLFNAAPTLVNADNGVFDITDANLEAAQCIGVIDFAAANWKSTNSNAVNSGTINGSPPDCAYLPAAANGNIYGVLVSRGTPTYATISDLVVRLYVTKD